MLCTLFSVSDSASQETSSWSDLFKHRSNCVAFPFKILQWLPTALRIKFNLLPRLARLQISTGQWKYNVRCICMQRILKSKKKKTKNRWNYFNFTYYPKTPFCQIIDINMWISYILFFHTRSLKSGVYFAIKAHLNSDLSHFKHLTATCGCGCMSGLSSSKKSGPFLPPTLISTGTVSTCAQAFQLSFPFLEYTSPTGASGTWHLLFPLREILRSQNFHSWLLFVTQVSTQVSLPQRGLPWWL